MGATSPILFKFKNWENGYLGSREEIRPFHTNISLMETILWSIYFVPCSDLGGPGGLNLVDHGIDSLVLFTSSKKILIPTKVIAGKRLALMCISITCANFKSRFLENGHFQISIPYWALSFHEIILKLDRNSLEIISNRSFELEFLFRFLNSKCWQKHTFSTVTEGEIKFKDLNKNSSLKLLF